MLYDKLENRSLGKQLGLLNVEAFYKNCYSKIWTEYFSEITQLDVQKDRPSF